MNLHSETGDIVELAPSLSQFVGLWLRDGFNRNFQTWKALLERYPGIIPLTDTHDVEKPWRNAAGATFELSRPDGLLRYIHVLPDPANAHGCPNLMKVGKAVGRALDIANGLGVQKVGFIHIPASRGTQKPTDDEDIMSAGAMIGGLGEWDASHPGIVTDVFLVDFRGHFDRFVWAANPPPPDPIPPLPE